MPTQDSMKEFQRLRALYEEALERPATSRDSWLRAQCLGQEEVYAEVSLLLSSAGDSNGFLTRPALQLAAEQYEPVRDQGSLISGRRLLQRLAGSELEEVWLAQQPDGTLVDVRLPKLDFQQPAMAERFRADIEALAGVQHGHLACLLGAGTDETGAGFYVTEHVEGWPLERYVDELALGPESRMRLFCQFSGAVAALHAQGLAHGALTPAALRVSVDGRVKLMDPGVANRLHSDRPPHRQDDIAALGRLLTTLAGDPATGMPGPLRACAGKAEQAGYADVGGLIADVERWLQPPALPPARLLDRLKRRLTAGREGPR